MAILTKANNNERSEDGMRLVVEMENGSHLGKQAALSHIKHTASIRSSSSTAGYTLKGTETSWPHKS